MRQTTEKSTWLGTHRSTRGRWRGVPYVISTHSRKGMTRAGWLVAALTLLLLVTVVLVEELLT